MSEGKLVRQAKHLINLGVYDPEDLFKLIYKHNRVHYSRVRDAIHIAKGQ